MNCEGECSREGLCFGEVRYVTVTGNGFKWPFYFSYCQEAREEDERRGFVVNNAVKCTCTNSLQYSNCDKHCERTEVDQF